MPAIRLEQRIVAKPWGRCDLSPWFTHLGGDERIGEIWFTHPELQDAELLVKYLFTSEKLSIQVHPDAEAAAAAGLARGKDEAWIVLAAEPDASIALGLREPFSAEELRAGAENGRIEQMVEWRKVAAGDVFYSPAGTVHAIGAGLSLIEIQQNLDLTYRLYDYGRPRELHLDQGIAAAKPDAHSETCTPRNLEPGRALISRGPAFSVEKWVGAFRRSIAATQPLWIVPLTPGGSIDGVSLDVGSTWVVNGMAAVDLLDGGELLVAYAGEGPRTDC
jgi:mannose-6-phosphate isomerase